MAETRPCGWNVDTSAYPDYVSIPASVRAMAEQWAQETLWALSGRRFGVCPVTVRPTRQGTHGSYQTYEVLWSGTSNEGGWVPVLYEGAWYNMIRGYPDGYNRFPWSQYWLPGPVVEVTEVQINGATLAPEEYRVDNGNWLVRQDGSDWPQFQSLSRPVGEEGTWIVSYTRGVPVPKTGEYAAGAMAYEYAKELQAGGCALDARVQSITRNGVSMEVLPEDGGDVNLTGVLFADRWLRTVNPAGLRQPPLVSTPDLPVPRVTTWTADV